MTQSTMKKVFTGNRTHLLRACINRERLHNSTRVPLSTTYDMGEGSDVKSDQIYDERGPDEVRELGVLVISSLGCVPANQSIR